ncbi:MAG: hypothetical protein U5J78_00230 [Parasphingorhabdus sp.]|nr:hypothetical protein [Parasphingorhabdus sp.]
MADGNQIEKLRELAEQRSSAKALARREFAQTREMMRPHRLAERAVDTAASAALDFSEKAIWNAKKRPALLSAIAMAAAALLIRKPLVAAIRNYRLPDEDNDAILEQNDDHAERTD